MLPLLLLLLVPVALATGYGGFIITPTSKNATVGATVHFTCQHTNGDVFWRINGERVDGYSAASIGGIAGLHTLTIGNAPADYDGIEIQCMVYRDGQVREQVVTGPAILRLQGRLAAVSDVHVSRNASTLFWTPPFSLDLNDIDPDIAYCVDIYNVTCGRKNLIISDCNVTEPRYTFDAPSGYIYEYIVIPRSNVEGGRNGTPSQPLRERFARLGGSFTERKSKYSLQISFANPEPSGPLPTSITVLLDSVDGLEDQQHNTTNITQEGDWIVIDVIPGLPSNRLWNCTMVAYGCKQNKLLDGVELSTHDIQDVSITSPHPGTIRVMGNFIDGSTATGLLVTTVHESDHVNHHLITREGNMNGVDSNLSGLASGQYTVSVFVVDRDGVPLERAATQPKHVSVEHGSLVESQPLTIEYNLKSTSSGVWCITCTFPMESSATDCVAVVYQRISQLSSSGLMNIESIHQLSRSGDTAYGCIEGIDEDNYQVGVIGAVQVAIDLPENSNGSCVCGKICITIVALLTLVLMFYMVVVAPFMVFCYVCWRLQPGKKNNTFKIRHVHFHSFNEARERHSNVTVQSGPEAAPSSSQPLLNTTEGRADHELVNDHSVTVDSNNIEDSGPATDKAEQDYEIPELGLKPANISNDQCQEIDSEGTIVIDMEATMAVGEAIAHAEQDSGSNNGDDEADQATDSEMESTSNKEVIQLSTTTMHVKGEKQEPADDVKSLNNESDMNVASEDNILQESRAETNPTEEIPSDQLNVAEDQGNRAETKKDTTSESTPAAEADDIHVQTNSEGNDPIGFQDKPVAYSTPLGKRHARIMQANSSSSEHIFIYINGTMHTRERGLVTCEGELDAVEATEQNAIQKAVHKSSHMTKGEVQPPEKDSDYASMTVDSCTSNDPYSDTVETEYQFEDDKKKTSPPPRYNFVTGNASNIPGDSGIGSIGMGTSTFMIFSEDQSCQTSFGDSKPFTKSCDFEENGGNMNNTMPEPGVLTKNYS